MTEHSLWRSPHDPERVMQTKAIHWQGQEYSDREELLAVEEPLEIRLGQQSLATIMRTPGHDFELTAGFLWTERVIRDPAELLSIEHALDADGIPLPNVVAVHLNPELTSVREDSTSFVRHFTISSSCGLCGKDSIADILQCVSPLSGNQPSIPLSTFYGLAARLSEQQTIFRYTGGLHAAALFTPGGELLLVREDVGRHNAVDKLIGYGLLHATFPYQEHILLVSGRTSFEILQKALLARIPCIAAISAPSSLAVELAASAGITLIGFLREQTMNVYTHPHRIT